MVKYRNTLFMTHEDIAADEKQVERSLVEMCDAERTFFNLGECHGALDVIRVVRGILATNEFENYILCIDRVKGVQWTDFFIRTLFKSSGKRLIIYLPASRSYDVTELLLRRNFFRNREVIVSNAHDMDMVKGRIGMGMVEFV